MADRYPMWAAEQAGTNRDPSIGATLLLFAVVAVVLLALLYHPEQAAGADGQRLQSPACAERARLLRHGVHAGPSYRRAAAACAATR